MEGKVRERKWNWDQLDDLYIWLYLLFDWFTLQVLSEFSVVCKTFMQYISGIMSYIISFLLCSLLLLSFGLVWYWWLSPIFFRVTSLALGQSCDYTSASEVTLKNMGNWLPWLHYELIRKSKDYVYGIWVYKVLGMWKVHDMTITKEVKTISAFCRIFSIWCQNLDIWCLYMKNELSKNCQQNNIKCSSAGPFGWFSSENITLIFT